MLAFINRIGETNIANNGMKMTIIAYRKNKDIDIQFEDGTIVYNKSYDAFNKGLIKHPNINTINRTGETNIANNGMKMTIIAYRGVKDCDIQFEDKTIAYHKRYDKFKEGTISYPKKSQIKNPKQYIGKTGIANNGMKMTIINCSNAKDIDVQFENGIIYHNKEYYNFKRGRIGFNKYQANIVNNIKLKEFAYKFNNKWYYICSNPNWAEDKILSVKEIYAYQPN